MVPGIGARGKKAFDVTARKIPLRVKVFCAACGVAGAGVLWDAVARASALQFEAPGGARLLHLACVMAAALVSLGMQWRDELEKHDGSHIGVVALLAVLAQLAFAGGVTWAGSMLLPATHVLLAARNTKGLYVAWRKKRIPMGRVREHVVTALCGVVAMRLLTHPHIVHGHGAATAHAMFASYAAGAASLLLAWANTHAERFPAVNASEMLRAAGLLLAADVLRAAGLAAAHGRQVLLSSLAVVVWGGALAAMGIATYRRKFKERKGL